MAHKRLSTDQMEDMKNMVVKGVSPEDISKHFHIAISSVHNYKKRFKQQGLKFPVVRGSRPTGNVDLPSSKTSKSLKDDLDQVENMARQIVNLQESLTKKSKQSDPEVVQTSSVGVVQVYKVIINNKLIEIKGDVQNVLLKNNIIEVVV